MVAGLQHDSSHIKMKLLELERAVSSFQRNNTVSYSFPLESQPQEYFKN
jgi:hypothetical protein